MLKVFLNLESFLLESLSDSGTVSPETVNSVSNLYGAEIDMHALQIETNVLRTIMSDSKVACFKDLYRRVT